MSGKTLSRDYQAKRLAAAEGIPYSKALRIVREALDREHHGTRPDVDPLAEPARIAVAGDWHANTGWAYDACRWAIHEGADAIVHLGDFGYYFQPQYLHMLDQALSYAGVPLLFVDGNHEDHRWLARQPLDERGLRRLSDWVWHLPRGFRWTWAGLRFLALGGAHSVDSIWRRREGHLWQREERITVDDVVRAADGGPADVLVAHDCPAGVPIPGIDVDRVDAPQWPQIELLRAEEHRGILRGVVEAVQPRAIWHGHYHVAYEAYADFGYGPVLTVGLDCDGTSMAENMRIVGLADLAQQIKQEETA